MNDFGLGVYIASIVVSYIYLIYDLCKKDKSILFQKRKHLLLWLALGLCPFFNTGMAFAIISTKVTQFFNKNIWEEK